MDKQKELYLVKTLYCYEYRGRYCIECGLDSFENPWIFDLHHRDPLTKDYNVSTKSKTARFESIKEELDKCDLMCAHCHRTLHAKLAKEEYETERDSIILRLDQYREENASPKKIGLQTKYTKEELQILIDSGKSIKDIAISIDEEYYATAALLRHYELETISGKRVRVSVTDSILRDYTKFKYSMEKMCRKYQKSEEFITTILLENNIVIRPSKASTLIDVDEVRSLLESGVSMLDISKKLDCHVSSVERVIRKHNLPRKKFTLSSKL